METICKDCYKKDICLKKSSIEAVGYVFDYCDEHKKSLKYTSSIFMPNSTLCISPEDIKSVSMYEAIPELIPDGMRYSKEFDKLVPDVVNEKTDSNTVQNKYDRKIIGKDGIECVVDVYDVLKAFDVKCPALQHLIKKALCAGLRGHKDLSTDLQDIIDSSLRAKKLYENTKK